MLFGIAEFGDHDMKKDIQKELEKLQGELQGLKEKQEGKTIKSYFRLAQGVIIGLSFTAIVAIAGTYTKPFNFTTATPISASEVNANFDTLYTAVNNNNAGFIATFATNYAQTCSPSVPPLIDTPFDQIEETDNNYDNTTYEYTVPATGYYRVALKIDTTNNISSSEINVNGTGTYLTTTGSLSLRKFNIGDVVKIQISCDDKKGNVTTTMAAGTSYFTIIKIL